MAARLGIRQFIAKVREGDIDTIRANIRAHGLPKGGKVYTDYTALRTALSHGHIEIAKLLISEGCRINPESERPSVSTPLHLAVAAQNIEIVTMLLERDVNPYINTVHNGSIVDWQNFHGETPLHLAAENGQMQIFDILLPLATSVDTKDTQGNSPLHSYLQALLYRGTDSCDDILGTIDILLKKGAAVETKNSRGITPAHLAMELKNRDISMKFLERIDNVDLCDNKNRSLLHFLAGISYAKKSARYYPSYFRRYKDTYRSPPSNSIELPEIAKIILAKNATIDLCDNHRFTPLHISVLCRQSDLMRFLLEQGANVNAVNENGDATLHLLIDTLSDETTDLDVRITDMLVTGGANLEIVNKHSMSLLHVAAHNRKLRMMLVLLGHCCKKVAMLRDQQGNTALHIILASFCTTAVETELYVEVTKQFLLKAGDCLGNVPNKEGETPLHLAAREKHYEVMQVLLLNGADPMMCDCHGNTILHFLLRPAAEYSAYAEDKDLQSKLEEMIEEMLVTRCSLVNARNESGETPLHAAFFPDKIPFIFMSRMIRLLLQHGADPDAQDSYGNTALHFVMSYSYFDFTSRDSVDELLKFGVDINILNAHGHTALSCCREIGLRDMWSNHALKLREAYAEELLEMKRCQVCCQVADLWRMPARRLVVFAANLKLRQLVFESEEFTLKFPHYLDLIRANFRKACIRCDLIGSAKLALDELCQFAWPDICSERILKNFSNEILQNLIEASQLEIDNKRYLKELDEVDVRPAKRLKTDNV